LMDPSRAMIATRALRRAWHLHSDGDECVASDDLVTSLLPREARISLHSHNESGRLAGKKIAVGSIYVTGSTTDVHHAKGQQSIHLLRHGKIDGVVASKHPQNPSRFALEWTTQYYESRLPENGDLPYERIPDTPYIGRGGGKAIPVRRFDRIGLDGEPFKESFYGQPPKAMYEQFRKLGIVKLGHWSYGKHHDLITINLGLAIDRDALLRGPMTTWLLKTLRKLKASGADIVIYPAHNSTGKIIHAAQEAARRDSLTHAIPTHYVPVHFLSAHAQTAIRIPSPTYDRIRKLIEAERNRRKGRRNIDVHPSNSGENDAKIPVEAVLLDDGALTGKVQSELEQLIHNAGATSVYHLGLVNRTGLPLYRQYIIDHYKTTHEYFWRWDVPTLGNARTCPLCHAIDQANVLSRTILSRIAKKELSMWKETWQSQSVTSHWWRHGLSPAELPFKREVTFGKEWKKLESSSKPEILTYKIPHTTTTGLAATAAEIMRATSYKAVGTKFIKDPWSDNHSADERKDSAWRRAKIELAITQILLFFDDLSEGELLDRFKLLLHELIDTGTDAADLALERLGCLILLLTPEDQAKPILEDVVNAIGMTETPLPTHVSILIGILLRRASINPPDIRELAAKAEDKHRTVAYSKCSTAYAYGVEEATTTTTDAIHDLILLLGENDTSTHTGFLRRKVIGEIRSFPGEIRDHLSLIVKRLGDIKEDTLLIATEAVEFSPIEFISALQDIIDESPDDQLIQKSKEILFAGEKSLAPLFRREFIYDESRLHEFILSCISEKEWQAEVEKDIRKLIEANNSALSEEYRARWYRPGNHSPSLFIRHIIHSNRPRKHIIFPSICRTMLREFLLNGAHSAGPFQVDDDDVDMVCQFSISTRSTFDISLSNRCRGPINPPSPKTTERRVSRIILKDPVSRHDYDTSNDIFSITVRLPLTD
jgi:hypothetical protein